MLYRGYIEKISAHQNRLGISNQRSLENSTRPRLAASLSWSRISQRSSGCGAGPPNPKNAFAALSELSNLVGFGIPEGGTAYPKKRSQKLPGCLEVRKLRKLIWWNYDVVALFRAKWIRSSSKPQNWLKTPRIDKGKTPFKPSKELYPEA